MKTLIKTTAAVWLAIALTPAAAHAQQSTAQAPPPPASNFPAGIGYLGGNAGIGTANNDVGTGLNYGGELAFFPATYVGLGALYRGTNHGTAKSSFYGAEVLLRPLEPFTLGFLLGGVSLSDAGVNTGSAVAYGGKIGYDFRLGSTPFTLGPEVDVLFFKPGPTTTSDVDMLAAFKIWI